MKSDLRNRLAMRFLAVFLTVWLAFFLHAQSQLQVGYATISGSGGSPVPVGVALFTYANASGTMVSQAAVGAADPIASGRIFVDESGTQTGIALVNPSAQDAPLTLILRDSSGVEVQRKKDTLGAGKHSPRYIAQIFGSLPPAFVGSLTFESAQKLAALTLREGRNSRDEPLYTTLPVVDLAAPPAASTLYFPQVAAGDGYVTQIILLNVAPQRISGRIQFTDSLGDPLALRLNGRVDSQFQYAIEANGTYRAELDRPAGLKAGYAAVSPDPGSSSPAGTAIFQFKRNGALVSEAGVGSAIATTAARVFVDTTIGYTGVALASTIDQPNPITFNLLDRYGALIDAVTRTLPPKGHLAVFAHELFPDAAIGFTGMMEIASSGPVAPVTLKLTDNSRGDQILTTLPVADLTRPVVSTSAVFPQIALGAGFSTNLIFINSYRSSVSEGRISFFQSSGDPLVVPVSGETNSLFSYRLAGGGARQFLPGNTARIASITLPDSGEVTVNAGKSLRPDVLMIDSAGQQRSDFQLSYASLDPDIATVDESGLIRGIKPGFSTLTVSAAGVVTTATITVVGVNSGASGFEITGIARDLGRRLYFTNTGSHTILLAQALDQTPDLYAGIPNSAGLKNDLRKSSLFNRPAFMAFNQAQGNLYISDSANNSIRVVHPGPSGTVETLAAGLTNPQGIALDNRGNLWIADSGSHTIKRINLATRSVENIAGKPGAAGWEDAAGGAARFSSPAGIALETEPLALQLEREAKGLPTPPISFIVADTGNGVLRRVKENGAVETLRPGGSSRGVSAGGPQLLTGPVGVAVDAAGTIYVTEASANRVRAILRNGDLVSAAQPKTFLNPRGVVAAENGRIIVAESSRAAREIVYGEPIITTITPGRFGNKGGTRITVRGKNFAPDTLVVAAGVVVSDRTIGDTQTITFTAPVLPSGSGILTIQNRGGIAQTSILVEPAPWSALPAGYITTIAGGSTYGGEGSLATVVPMSVSGVAIDSAGNLFIADTENHRVRRVDQRTGIVTSVAGNGQDAYSGDDGPATAAAMSAPSCIAFDKSGNLYISDPNLRRIRKVDAVTGIITTVAGGNYGDCGDGGNAKDACFVLNNGITLDGSGNLYIADTFNHRVRRVDGKTAIITTVAGNGAEGYSGDGKAATAASLRYPVGVAVDDTKNVLYIADTDNNRVRTVDLGTGIINNFAGGGSPSDELGDDLAATSARLAAPRGLFMDSGGNLFIADRGNSRIRRVDASTGKISTVAGGGYPGPGNGDGGPATGAYVSDPLFISVDAGGNLFITGEYSYRLRKVDRVSGTIATVAGTGEPVFLGDNGAAIAATLIRPRAVLLDPQGNYFIADSGSDRVRRIDAATGVISTYAGGGFPETGNGDGGPAAEASSYAYSIAFDENRNLYIADTWANRIRKVDAATRVITTIAGTGEAGYSGDGGKATDAMLHSPERLAMGPGGYLFFSDEANRVVRKVHLPTGIITTVAGGGTPAQGIGDGDFAVKASLGEFTDIAVDGFGTLFIADSDRGRIRKVDSQTRIISTVAGGGSSHDENVAATDAEIAPNCLALDKSGNLFVLDLYVNAVRMVDSLTKQIKTVAGGGPPYVLGDNGPATDAFLLYPSGITIDPSGNLLIVDTDNKRLRLVRGPVR